jgi:4-alpha-glucanotransferase
VVTSSTRPLLELARECGVQARFRETTGRLRVADAETLLAVLAALGEPLRRPEDAAPALAARRAERAGRLVEPVVVAWDGRLAGVEVRLPARAPGRLRARIELEHSEERTWSARTDDARSGSDVATLRVADTVPFGRHELTVELGRRAGVATILSAPRRVGAAEGRPDWGAFLPLHALVTERGWGIGDLTGLAELAELIRELGGGMVATLPLLAGFPGEASPYRPVSRVFWNEVYADVAAVPEFSTEPAVRRLVSSPSFRRELDAVRSGELVDHGRVLSLKRRALERIVASLGADRSAELRRFVRGWAELETYARFRAAGERFGLDWRRWPTRARNGAIRPSDVDPDAVAYYRLAQWVCEEQVTGLGRRAREGGVGLYLDMPLGVHPDGYDAWRHRRAFAAGVSVGAPPDDFFPGGQDWGVPPLHPERVREEGYAYPIACLRHVFRHAGVARLDHAIGLHRQYWVPHGASADRGVFVRFREDEWYAAISLEAHRTGTIVVGEDLGTVPKEIRTAMDRHRLLRCYVLELETLPERTPPVPDPVACSLSALNTHDLPTFAAYWRGVDIEARRANGFLRPEEVDVERRLRAAMRADVVRALVGAGLLRAGDGDDERAVLGATLTWLGASASRLVVVNLEDLWGELQQQNVPGTSDRPNFRRRAALGLEELRASEESLEILRRLDAARRGLLEEGDAA